MRKALLIGVQHYTGGYSDRIGPAVRADIKAIRALFTELRVQIVDEVSGDEQGMVSQNRIRESIAVFLVDAQPEDDLIVYYTGHGAQFDGVPHLVPSEANARLPKPQKYLVPLDFTDEIEQSRAKSLTFVIDACRNGTDSETDRPVDPEPAGKVVSHLFATRSSEVARTVSGPDSISVFTGALMDVVPSLSPSVRLAAAEERLQQRVDEICERSGLSRQRIDVVSNEPKDRAPFPLFRAAISSTARDTWSRLLRHVETEVLGDLAGGGDGPAFSDLLTVLDRIHSETRTAGALSEWFEPSLPGRLTKALALVTDNAMPSEFEKLLFVGVAAAVEAAFRATEAEMLAKPSIDRSVKAVLASEPATRRLIETGHPHAERLHSWVVHLATPRECGLRRTGDLAAKISEVLRVFLPDDCGPAFRETADHLRRCIRSAFASGHPIAELPEQVEVDAGDRTHVLHCRRFAVALRLTWLLSLDTRLFSAHTGMHLLQAEVPVEEVLGSLEHAKWKPVASILDLSFSNNAVAALDLALRELVTDVNALLLEHRHLLGAVFYGTPVPLAAAASRLEPARKSFRLPHIMFEVSAAETQALLMGTNLYQDPALAVRELYQNAVDACHYRMQRTLHKLKKLPAEHMPEIRFEMGEDEQGRPYLECYDTGIGMSEHVLREAFAKAGRRFRDLPEFIEEQAEWTADEEMPAFEPISQFGIGVLSYFMIADRLEIWTKRVDQNLNYERPLKVEISGGNALFHVTEPNTVDLPRGGSRIRLFLSSEAAEMNLAEVLREIIRVPLVPVEFRGNRWEASRLYTPQGPVKTFLDAPDLGVYLHEDVGAFLVNGIPIAYHQSPIGCTISLGAWARPELSVDRRTLLAFQEKAAMTRLQAAVSLITPANAVTGNWLLGIFDTDLVSGIKAYQAVEHNSLRISVIEPENEPIDIDSRKFVDLIPAIHGIFVDDPRALRGEGEIGILGDFRFRYFARAMRPEAITAGLPRFDAHLIALTSVASRIEGAPRQDNITPAISASKLIGADRFMGDLIRLAQAWKVTLGSAACFAWACAFIEQPQSVFLKAEAAQLKPSEEDGEWRRALKARARLLTAIGPQSFGTRVQLMESLALDTEEAAKTRALSTLSARIPDVPPELMPALREFLTTRRPRPSARRSMWYRILGVLHESTPYELTPWDSLASPGGPYRGRLRPIPAGIDKNAPIDNREISAVKVAISAYIDRILPSSLAKEFKEEGYEILAEPEDWLPVEELLRDWGSVLLRDPNRPAINIISRLVSLAEILETAMIAGWSRLDQGLAAAAGTLIATGDEASLRRMIRDNKDHLAADAIVLRGPIGKRTINLEALVHYASKRGMSLGDAFVRLHQYRDLVKAWEIPEVPDDLQHRFLGDVPAQYFSSIGHHSRTPEHRALLALRSSAVTGTPLAELAAEVRPLLRYAGEDTGRLDRLAELLPGAVTFDDLLLAGCLQFEPPIDDPRQMAAMCRPFAREPDALLERAKLLAAVGPLRFCEPEDD